VVLVWIVDDGTLEVLGEDVANDPDRKVRLLKKPGPGRARSQRASPALCSLKR